ncbi:TPA: restriction endonuclease subunit S [Streptococcus suis]|nr:restriction endonuclease subunit S [Streptococcus suis]HEM5105617.1 restriction endonuclease subunit S [Streptococcus suis]
MPNKDKNIPKRRFKAFENADAWELRKLGEVADVCSGRDYKHLETGSIPVYGTGGYMLSVSEALSKNEDAIGIGRKGTIDSPYILRAPFWTVDTLFYCIPQNDFTLEFAYSVFQNINWKSMDESTGVPSLSKNGINNVRVLTPKIQEQSAIGTFFSTLDSQITLHQRKLDKLKNVKQAYLSEMFPAEGERVPKRRFPGFTDDWELRKLGEVGAVAMCRRIFKEQTSEIGEIPFYKIGTFGGTPDAFISKELFEEYRNKYPYPTKGDILISASGSIGRTVEFLGKDEYFQDSNIVWLKHDGKIDNIFLKQFYSIVKWSGVEGSTIKRLYNENILNTEIALPSLLEQKAIGIFFSTLDRQITLHQRKLEKLKNLKKALLNELFV